MYTKLKISGIIEVETGMHIGGSSAFSPIGAVDSPVIRDARSNLPMIPGSSLKGKIRTLLAKGYNRTVVEPDEDAECITRLFGCAKKGKAHKSRLQFSDMVLRNKEQLHKQGVLSVTEVKFENSIKRQTAVANPRQIERAIRGSEFELDVLYEVENEDEVVEDMEVFANGMRYLQYDYLGGHGTRGYGKVCFRELKIETVLGAVDSNILTECQKILEGV